MNRNGESIALWIIATVLVIFLIGGIAILYGLGEAAENASEPAKVENVEFTAKDHGNRAVLLVSFDGQKEDYDLTLQNPDGISVDSAFVLESDMADREETVRLQMTEDIEKSPMGGTYSVSITDDAQNLVYDNEFSFSGAELEVENYSVSFEDYGIMGYSLKSVDIELSNSGDLPSYVTHIRASIDSQEEKCFVPDEKVLIPAGETRTVSASNFIAMDFEETGSYSAEFELIEGNFGNDVVKTISTTVEVG